MAQQRRWQCLANKQEIQSNNKTKLWFNNPSPWMSEWPVTAGPYQESMFVLCYVSRIHVFLLKAMAWTCWTSEASAVSAAPNLSKQYAVLTPTWESTRWRWIEPKKVRHKTQVSSLMEYLVTVVNSTPIKLDRTRRLDLNVTCSQAVCQVNLMFTWQNYERKQLNHLHFYYLLFIFYFYFMWIFNKKKYVCKCLLNYSQSSHFDAKLY